MLVQILSASAPASSAATSSSRSIRGCIAQAEACDDDCTLSNPKGDPNACPPRNSALPRYGGVCRHQWPCLFTRCRSEHQCLAGPEKAGTDQRRRASSVRAREGTQVRPASYPHAIQFAVEERLSARRVAPVLLTTTARGGG